MTYLSDTIKVAREKIIKDFYYEEIPKARFWFDSKVNPESPSINRARKDLSLMDVVYFLEMRLDGNSVVKIGKTIDIIQRFRALGGREFDYLDGGFPPTKKHLLCVISPKCHITDMETAIHHILSEHRVYQKEYFAGLPVFTYLQSLFIERKVAGNLVEGKLK